METNFKNDETIIEVAKTKGKLEAVKICKLLYGVNLKDAKVHVDEITKGILLPKPKISKKGCIGALVLTVLIGLIIAVIVENTDKAQDTNIQNNSYSKSDTKTEIEKRKDLTISAEKLMRVYNDNEVKADDIFKGKSFYVEGIITNIKKDLMDDIYVTLRSSDIIRCVQCYFDNKETAAKLEKGMSVTFYGKCDGLMMNVLMKDCQLVDNLSDLEKQVK